MFTLSNAIQRTTSLNATPPGPLPQRRIQNETWTPERVEQLRRGFDAGRSCAQIAGEIGVSRNAVIGKLNRMGLKRTKDVLREQVARTRAARQKVLKSSTKVSIKRLLQSFRSQQSTPTVVFSEPPPSLDIVPINNGRGPTLIELGPKQCRWPFGTPGAEDFCYCGHESVEGLSYCLGHVSIAYRAVRRPRISAIR